MCDHSYELSLMVMMVSAFEAKVWLIIAERLFVTEIN
jgi:hypothetical protein